MEYILLSIVALLASGLTLFSGFGLGTILLPAFALFFPIEIAITLTAIVHFLNNIFKVILVGKNAHWKTILIFGIPAILFAFLGATLLQELSTIPVLFKYSIGNAVFTIEWIKIIIGVLLFLFAIIDIVPQLKNLQFSERYLPLGGVLSGFFGGLSGHQGVLRTAFLIRANLTKEQFIATGVIIACFIDFTRLGVYKNHIISHSSELDFKLVGIATLSAFLGAFYGNKLVKKVTLEKIQQLVAVLIMLFSILIILGIL